MFLDKERVAPRILLPECKYILFYRIVVESLPIHSTSIFDIQWYHDETQLITAGADRLCQIFDVETQQILQKAQDHSGSLKCIAKTEENSVIATGGRDGKIFFYDVRQGLAKYFGEFMFS